MCGMKSWLCILLIAASSMLATITLAQDASPEDIRKDPVESFKELVASFPKKSIAKSKPGMAFKIEVADYDVKKTDSSVGPIIGLINFSTDEPNNFGGVFDRVILNLQMVFEWHDGKWKFEKLLNTENGIDFTNMGAGEDLMGAGKMLDFLKPYRDQAQ